VPALPPGLTYVEVAAGGDLGGSHTVARRSDGSVVAWGRNGWGQCNVPALRPGLTYVEVAAGGEHTVARLSDNSVVAWGRNNYGECNVPALSPGMTFAHGAAGEATTVVILQSGAFNIFAAGCPGSAGITHIDAAPPRVGMTTRVVIKPLPQKAALLVFGFSNTTSTLGSLPLDLTVLGLPGCLGRVSLDFTASVRSASSSATWSLAVPNVPALAGVIAHCQAIVFDPAAGNAAGLVMSDAATLVVGP